MIKSLPVFELTIDDLDSFVDAIALVENPAIQTDFIAFSEKAKHTFSIDDEKQELLGAAMIPDQKIYRQNEAGEEFEVFFSSNTIRQIAQSFFKRKFQSNINIEHNDAENADSYVFQSFIIDKAKGISFMDLPDGTWVVGVKVLNPEVWADIKTGKRKGFSVEGVFQLERKKFNTEEDEIIELLKELQKRIKKHI